MRISRFPAILAFTAVVACSPEQIETTPNTGTEIPVLIARDAQFSKTTMNPADYSVSWSDGDHISVFNRQAGTGSWSGNLEFSVGDTDAGRSFLLKTEFNTTGKPSILTRPDCRPGHCRIFLWLRHRPGRIVLRILQIMTCCMEKLLARELPKY